MDDFTNSEKRRFPRAVFPCKIMLWLPRERTLITHTENIGNGGIRVIVEEHIPLSCVVGLELFLTPSFPLRCKGKVVWELQTRNPITQDTLMYDIGFEFMDISAHDAQYISHIVEEIRKQPHA